MRSMSGTSRAIEAGGGGLSGTDEWSQGEEKDKREGLGEGKGVKSDNDAEEGEPIDGRRAGVAKRRQRRSGTEATVRRRPEEKGDKKLSLLMLLTLTNRAHNLLVNGDRSLVTSLSRQVSP